MEQHDSASVQNWNAFWDFHLGSWNGRWTRYQPNGSLSESFQSSRTFQSDSQKKTIRQLNQYFYTDGQRAKKEWSYSFAEHCKEDGFIHPASDYMRGLAFMNGAAAWLVPKVIPNQYFPIELFLTKKNVRHSVGMLYGLDGTLERTACIREHRNSLEQSPWSEEIELIPAWDIGHQWTGTTEIIDAALKRSTIKDIFNSTLKPNQNEYHFPDNIILRCPKKLVLNNPTTICSIWMESDDRLRTITASYGTNMKLIDVRLQQLSRQTQ